MTLLLFILFITDKSNIGVAFKNFYFNFSFFCERRCQNGLSEDVLCSSNENNYVYAIPQHPWVYSYKCMQSKIIE